MTDTRHRWVSTNLSTRLHKRQTNIKHSGQAGCSVISSSSSHQGLRLRAELSSQLRQRLEHVARDVLRQRAVLHRLVDEVGPQSLEALAERPGVQPVPKRLRFFRVFRVCFNLLCVFVGFLNSVYTV